MSECKIESVGISLKRKVMYSLYESCWWDKRAIQIKDHYNKQKSNSKGNEYRRKITVHENEGTLLFLI